METVRLSKSVLIDIVQKNRTKHEETYKKAVTKYCEKLTAELAEKLTKVKSGKMVTMSTTLPKPASYLKEYDTIIGMLKMSVDDIVEISSAEYQQYVEDRWGWSQHFLSNSTSYSEPVNDETEDD